MKPDAFKFTVENKVIKISERYISISGQEMESQAPLKRCYLPTKLYGVKPLYNHRRGRLKSHRKFSQMRKYFPSNTTYNIYLL